jgi:hypothetical protein
MVHAVEIGALSDDPQTLVHGQHFGSSCTKDRLRIGQYKFIHNVRLTCWTLLLNVLPPARL